MATKYEIFLNLSRELINLIKELESDLKTKLAQNQSNATGTAVASSNPSDKTLGYKVGERLRSFWDKVSRPSLKEYCEYLETIDQLANELIINYFGDLMIEQYNVISPIIDKFKINFSKILLKYQNIIKSSTDIENSKDSAATGVPDTISAGETEELLGEVEKIKPKIEKSVQDILTSSIRTEEINPSDFENGRVKPESFGKVLEWLISRQVDIKNEASVSNQLKGYNYTANNFVSLLNHTFNKSQLDQLIFELENKNKLIHGGVDKVVEKFVEIIKSKNDKEEIKKFINIIIQSIDDENSMKDVLNSIADASDEHINDEQRVIFTILNSPDHQIYVEKIKQVLQSMFKPTHAE